MINNLDNLSVILSKGSLLLDNNVKGVLNSKDNSFLVIKTLDEGASTTLVAVLDPALKNGPASDGKGIYLDNCQIGEPAPWASDPAAAARSACGN